MLSEADRRAIIGGAVIIGALVCSEGAPRWLALRNGQRDQLQRVLKAELKARRLELLLPTLSETLDARTLRLSSMSPRLLPGHSPSVVVSNLARRVAELASDAHVKLEQLDPAPSKDSINEVVIHARIRCVATGVLGEIIPLIDSIEDGFPTIRVRSITLTPSMTTDSTGEGTRLRMEVLLEGLARRETRQSVTAERSRGHPVSMQ